MQNSKHWSRLVAVALLVAVSGGGIASAVVADSPVTPLSPSRMMVVCVEQSSSRLFQAVANRCDTASQFKLVWPVRGAAPQVCVNTLSREMTLSSSGTCRAKNAFLARATAKRSFLGCADRDTGMLRWPRTGVCWWQNTSMVLMAAVQTSTTTTTTSSSTTTTFSTTTTSVPSVVAPVLVSVSASDGVQITVAGMRPDTGVYALQWVLQGSTFNTYQMARATSPSMSVPAGWFACNRTYTFRVFVMQADWQLADGHQTQNVTPHSTPFDVVMPACPAPATTTTTIAPASCATGGVCIVGDTGPGGGIVFYVSATNFTSTGSDCGTTCKYLEAAPADQSAGIVWATADAFCYNAGGTTSNNDCQLNSIYSGDTTAQAASRTAATAIGMGMANTNQIHARLTTAGGALTSTYAAGIAWAYDNNSKTDWHLPSKDELNELYNQKVTVGGFSADFYWSSSEGGTTVAWAHRFTNYNFRNTESKRRVEVAFYVRPVRAFG